MESKETGCNVLHTWIKVLESFKLSPQQKIQRCDSLWKIDFMFSNYLFYNFSYKCTINFFYFLFLIFYYLKLKKKKTTTTTTITINTINYATLSPFDFDFNSSLHTHCSSPSDKTLNSCCLSLAQPLFRSLSLSLATTK